MCGCPGQGERTGGGDDAAAARHRGCAETAMEEWRGPRHTVSLNQTWLQKTANKEKDCYVILDLALFPSLFLSEGKAMELFRKLREKPRGLDAMHGFTSYVTLVSGISCENKPHLCSSGFPFPSLCSDQRCPGDGQEVVRLVVQAVQFYERKLRDFYTHLRYSNTERYMFP